MILQQDPSLKILAPENRLEELHFLLGLHIFRGYSRKLTCPVKINGFQDVFPIEIVPFF